MSFEQPKKQKKSLFPTLNPLKGCRKYGVSAWQCPQFLFLIMGIIILIAIFTTYFIAITRINSPAVVSIIVLLVGGSLMIISFIITHSFEKVADASRMKTEFIAVVSHQLRAPLTNLRFSLDFLVSNKSSPASKEQMEYFSIIKENTQRMGDLIDNLLTVSRIETGKFPLKKSHVSVKAIVNKMVLKFRAAAEASGVKVLLTLPKNLSPVWADQLWLEQVIENLLDNAIKYSKEGGGTVKVNVEQKGKDVHFEITDTGMGIPKEEQKFIFEKFFRSKDALRQQRAGSGLGLHIAKQVIELSGGKIGFRSQADKGTTFWFILPTK